MFIPRVVLSWLLGFTSGALLVVSICLLSIDSHRFGFWGLGIMGSIVITFAGAMAIESARS